tara:strand:- start:411 stop:734 length:324 start_codon:yes stop_codon:yes gene_type:complete
MNPSHKQKNMNMKNKFESCREINAKGYTFKGKAPAASCSKCGGWHSQGGMSQHFSSTSPVMGRLGCEVACGSIDPATEKELEKTFDFFKKMNEYSSDRVANFSKNLR